MVHYAVKNLTEEIKEENQVDKTELKRELSLFQAREKEDILELDAKVTDKISKQAGKARDLEEKMN